MKRQRIDLKSAPGDLQAGLTVGLESIPDGMASAILAGVNPVNGVHAAMVSITLGGLTTSSELVTITTANSIALASGLALVGLPEDARSGAILTLALLVGVFTIVASLLKVGRLVSLFSHAAMVGFITGAAILVILTSLNNITGYESGYTSILERTADLLLHLDQVNVLMVAVAALTFALAFLLGRTFLKKMSLVLAVVIASVVPIALQWGGVPQVSDIGSVTGIIPELQLPDLSAIDANLLTWALAISIIGMVQMAGLSRAIPNPDGRSASITKDFMAQGVCNAANSALGGMPIAGSISATALNQASGARTRLANISAGIIILVLMLLVGGLVLQLSVPALAALLIIAGYQAIRPDAIRKVWASGYVSRMEMLAVFGATMILPLHYAVFLGVFVSALLHVARSAMTVEVVEILPNDDGSFREGPAPRRLTSGRPTILEVHGTLLYAGAWKVERNLPSPYGTEGAVVIVRLHGQNDIGTTLEGILERYSEQLKRNSGRLMIAGVNDRVVKEMERTGMMDVIGKENVFVEGERLYGGIAKALEAARTWIEEKKPKGR